MGWSYSVSPAYRNWNRVWLDNQWFYTQSWSMTELIPLYTREIKISYLEDNINSAYSGSNEQKMEVTSLVQWMDKSSDNVHKVELKTVLSNWKNKK